MSWSKLSLGFFFQQKNLFGVNGELSRLGVVGASDPIEILWQTPQPPCLLWPYSCGQYSLYPCKVSQPYLQLSYQAAYPAYSPRSVFEQCTVGFWRGVNFYFFSLTESALLGWLRHRVAMSVCVWFCAIGCSFFFRASHWPWGHMISSKPLIGPPPRQLTEIFN